MKTLKQILLPYKIDTLDAEIIIAHTLGRPRGWILAHWDYVPTSAQTKKIHALFARRQKGEPIAYITGHKEFFGLDFLVDKRVLVPRPETEILVETILKDTGIKAIADIGTGSGCVAVALAKNNPKLKIYASDVSESAINMAKSNALRHKVKIIFKKGNLFAPFKNTPLDAIAANLPYGWKEWKNNCSMETRGLKFEPAQALFTGKNGLQLYEELFQQCVGKKITLFIEFDPRQTVLLKKIIKKYLPKASVKMVKDLAGHDRVAIIK